eukprot:CAMPEP_0204299838 /NCGR_PEP_ID=MMETSP0468-20130131/77499_1 /ASSEMBLY_ACC=CAM_ASM_000383 /TAXON_ID=2969 /ORGANISM="Oxyrrhis marina" /LENGTH=168 /DNA_ID=CAMNT_0051278843 /DNA_START=31 /DNA_END=537 /DNA_ORIENTATION=-
MAGTQAVGLQGGIWRQSTPVPQARGATPEPPLLQMSRATPEPPCSTRNTAQHRTHAGPRAAHHPPVAGSRTSGLKAFSGDGRAGGPNSGHPSLPFAGPGASNPVRCTPATDNKVRVIVPRLRLHRGHLPMLCGFGRVLGGESLQALALQNHPPPSPLLQMPALLHDPA